MNARSFNRIVIGLVVFLCFITILAGCGSKSTSVTSGTVTATLQEGITTDGTNFYVTDADSNIIRKVVIATGAVITLAGSTGLSGSTDGTGSAARFNAPCDITTDGTNLYVADSDNSTIRKVVIATGAVTTLAGTAGVFGSADGTGTSAQFRVPSGITTDGTSLYVADYYNSTIRKVVIATGAVTTLAGSPGVSGSADGTGSAARFLGLSGITTDGTNLYVADTWNRTIRKVVIATGAVTTLAGNAGVSGSTDETGSTALFNLPFSITNDGANLYVTDDHRVIRKVVIATGAVTTLADSTFDASGITTDGINLYVANRVDETIWKVVIATGTVTTLASRAGASSAALLNKAASE